MNMPDPPPPGDDELLVDLRDALSLIDPPPADLDDRARRAFGWDAALAVLTQQATASEAEPALRSAGAATVLRYRLDMVDVQLEVEPGFDESVTIVGTVAPAAEQVHAVESTGDRNEIELDDRGRFTTVTRAAGLVLQFRFADGRGVRTPVIELDVAAP